MSSRVIDPNTGAISFIPTKEEEIELERIRMVNTLLERITLLEARVKELEERLNE